MTFLLLLISVVSFLNLLLALSVSMKFNKSKQSLSWLLITLSFMLNGISYILMLNDSPIYLLLQTFFITLLFLGVLLYFAFLVMNLFSKTKIAIMMGMIFFAQLVIFLLLISFNSLLNSINVIMLFGLLSINLMLIILLKGGRLSFYWSLIFISNVLLLFYLFIPNHYLMLVTEALFAYSLIKMY